jgi:hypothetical protein
MLTNMHPTARRHEAKTGFGISLEGKGKRGVAQLPLTIAEDQRGKQEEGREGKGREGVCRIWYRFLGIDQH